MVRPIRSEFLPFVGRQSAASCNGHQASFTETQKTPQLRLSEPHLCHPVWETGGQVAFFKFVKQKAAGAILGGQVQPLCQTWPCFDFCALPYKDGTSKMRLVAD
jgi:hypothetical protein